MDGMVWVEIRSSVESQHAVSQEIRRLSELQNSIVHHADIERGGKYSQSCS